MHIQQLRAQKQSGNRERAVLPREKHDVADGRIQAQIRRDDENHPFGYAPPRQHIGGIADGKRIAKSLHGQHERGMIDELEQRSHHQGVQRGMPIRVGHNALNLPPLIDRVRREAAGKIRG